MPKFRKLEAEQIVVTAQQLHNRIAERFGDRNLAQVAGQLVQFATEAQANVHWYRQPNKTMRMLIALVLLIVPVVVGYAVVLGDFDAVHIHLHDFLQTVEAVLASLVFVGAAVVFLVSSENRIKRNRLIRYIDELRGLAHIVDMHQLTKDPERATGGGSEQYATASSPKTDLTVYELGRYLDYCSEMMSLISKVAALYAQASVDPAIGATVLEVEQLTTGLSRKIWQKIMLLHQVYARAAAGECGETAAADGGDAATPGGELARTDAGP